MALIPAHFLQNLVENENSSSEKLVLEVRFPKIDLVNDFSFAEFFRVWIWGC